MTNTFTLSLNVTTKIGRLTDTTDYASLGFNLANSNAKILGTITFQGEVIVQKLSVSSPLINLASGATYYEFPLELDQNGDVANGVYGVVLTLRMAASNLQIGASTNNILVGDGNPEYIQFLEVGDTLTFTGAGTEDRTITALELVSGIPVYTLDQNVVFNDYDGYSFDETHAAFTDTYNYSGCTLLVPCIEFTYDCTYGNSGTWSVINSTLITTQTLVSLSGTINYPSWTGEAPITVTSLPYVNNILAKGTYTTNITQVISQTQTDGLIIVYSINSIDEHKVVCVGPLCDLNPCIEKLRQAHEGALLSGRVSPYQAAVDNVNLYYIQAENYQSCGDFANYENRVALIVATIDATGLDCGCGCGDTDSSQIGWVLNTSQEAQDAIELLQEEVAELISTQQWIPYDGVPSANQDSLNGYFLNQILLNYNTGVAYIATDVTDGAAVWEIYYQGLNDYVESVTGNVVDNTDPLNPIVTALESIEGDGVDNTDPQNPIISWPNLTYYFSVTKTAFDILKNDNQLVIGAFYRITNFSTSTVFDRSWTVLVIANSTNTVQTQGWVVTRTLTVVAIDLSTSSVDFLENTPVDVRLTPSQVLDWGDEQLSSSGEIQVFIEQVNENVLMTYCENNPLVLRLTNVQNLVTGDFGTYNPTTDVFTPNAIVESVTGTAVDNTDPANPIVNSTGGSGALVYAAKLNQAGSGAPTATVLYNDTGETFSFNYVDVGVYTMVCSSSVLGDAVVFLNGGSIGTTYNAAIIGADTILITTAGSGTPANGRLNSASIKIEIY